MISCCRAGNERIIATGDSFGSVNLFKYPSVKEFSQCKSHVGHSSKVKQVKFFFDDSKLVSIGDDDKGIFI